jgi:DNA recombination protein RmuC
VDEKLQKPLDDRITQSFKMVSDRLQEVYTGLGEMKTLASGVGDLKKVLTNVKTRGIVGEYQLGAIIEELLTKEQYEENVVTKFGTANRVEYAIKLPGEGERCVYLPIDAKFPADTYSQLVDAYDSGDGAAIAAAQAALEARIKGCAKDIRDKYIDPPNTTDFAIMFLPFEGLYAEVVRRGLVDILQKQYRVNIAGPTTFAALLNSLQMGFRTLAIQKRSSEVWNILSAVKTEFNTFADVLAAAQKRIEQTGDELEKLVGVRTRKIKSKLREVSVLPLQESRELLDSAPESDE